jgi:hypothetical protein
LPDDELVVLSVLELLVPLLPIELELLEPVPEPVLLL